MPIVDRPAITLCLTGVPTVASMGPYNATVGTKKNAWASAVGFTCFSPVSHNAQTCLFALKTAMESCEVFSALITCRKP